MIAMNPLPVMDGSLQGGSQDWGQAVANMDGAKQVAETLRALVNDAVYLDEESFSTASNVVQYQQRIQVRAGMRAAGIQWRQSEPPTAVRLVYIVMCLIV